MSGDELRQWWANLKSNLESRNSKKALANIFQFYWFRPMVIPLEFPFSEQRFYVHWSRRSKPPPDNNRANYCGHTSVMGKTKRLKIRFDWVVSNENEYSISTVTSRFLFKSRVSWIESLKFESNQYQIAWYLNRIAQGLNRIFVAIQIAIESNRDLISPVTELRRFTRRRKLCAAKCERRPRSTSLELCACSFEERVNGCINHRTIYAFIKIISFF